MKNIRLGSRGDTIVEVIISIAVASLAIGITYSTAHRSLQQAITAKERNQALDLIQNQITDLQYRKLKTSSFNFNSNFSFPTNHFCLDDSANYTSDKAADWLPIKNYQPSASNPPNYWANNMAAASPASPSQPYDPSCHKKLDGIDYYKDITTSQATGGSVLDKTVYQVYVRWARLGGGTNNQSSIFFRF